MCLIVLGALTLPCKALELAQVPLGPWVPSLGGVNGLLVGWIFFTLAFGKSFWFSELNGSMIHFLQGIQPRISEEPVGSCPQGHVAISTPTTFRSPGLEPPSPMDLRARRSGFATSARNWKCARVWPTMRTTFSQVKATQRKLILQCWSRTHQAA